MKDPHNRPQKILQEQKAIQDVSFAQPDYQENELFAFSRQSALGEDFDRGQALHTKPPAWQRLALIPDGDFYKAIAAGQASAMTEIETFTERGIRVSLAKLEADIIVTATGFNFAILGGAVRDRRTDGFSPTVLPIAACCIQVCPTWPGSSLFRASWTLRADLIATYVSRLLNHMDEKGAYPV